MLASTPHHTTPHHTTPHHTTPHLSHHTRTAILCRSPHTEFRELSWGGPILANRDFPKHTKPPNHTKPHQTTPYHTIPHHTTIYPTTPHYTTPHHKPPIPSHAHRNSVPIAPYGISGALVGGRFRQTAIFHTTPNHQTTLNHSQPHHTTPYHHTIPHQEW